MLAHTSLTASGSPLASQLSLCPASPARQEGGHVVGLMPQCGVRHSHFWFRLLTKRCVLLGCVGAMLDCVYG
jgi:hypothetical protein